MKTQSPDQILHAAGLRQTLARVHVLQILLASPRDPWDPVAVFHALEARGTANIALSTVYDVLRKLEATGVLRREWHPGCSGLKVAYRLQCENDHPSGHHHVVCRICSRSVPIDDPLLLESLSRFMARHQMDMLNDAVTITGVCHRHDSARHRRTTGGTQRDLPRTNPHRSVANP